MKPVDLRAANFSKYPKLAQALALQYLSVLQQLPLPLAASILNELSNYDWLFPAERWSIESPLAFLQSLSEDKRDAALAGFRRIVLSNQISSQDWVNQPGEFLESMTAYLWSTHQFDSFSSNARKFLEMWQSTRPEPKPALPRLCIVVLGEGVRADGVSLFNKLRPHGIFCPQVDDPHGMQTILNALSERISQRPFPYEHWYIDGGTPAPWDEPHCIRISWASLEPVRNATLKRIQEIIHRGNSGPEQLRTEIAKTRPSDIGFSSEKDEVLARFELSIFTQGSGTQIFSTTFAQWTAREALRRARPSTLVVRFATRQRQLSMDELLANKEIHKLQDPAGSLLDADMGSFYTWINQQRLTGSDQARFIAWSQEHRQAVSIGPSCPKGTTTKGIMSIADLLEI
ncbi:MAG TPA: hypothetical protein VFE38_03415 [Edaphobacter sp.]|nr:hypothetical protein [Edaphobacter sp.]